MSVEKLSIDELRLKLSRELPRIAPDLHEQVDAAGNTTLTVDLAALSLRYDTPSQILVLVTTIGVPAADIVDDQLVEVDIETWTPLVTPFNADPLKPR